MAHSRNDRAISVKNGSYLADHIHGLKYIEYAEGGKFPYLGKIEQIVGDFVSFFSNINQSYGMQSKSLTTVLFPTLSLRLQKC